MEIKKIQPYVLEAMDNLYSISQVAASSSRQETLQFNSYSQDDEGMSSSFQETQTGAKNLRPLRN
jgi:hypothetical protein